MLSVFDSAIIIFLYQHCGRSKIITTGSSNRDSRHLAKLEDG